MKIRTRLTLYFVLLVTALMVSRAIVNYYYLQEFTNKKFYARLHKKLSASTDLLLKDKDINARLISVIEEQQKNLFPGENITIYNADNKKIYTNSDTISFKISAQLFNEIKRKKYVTYSEGSYKIIGLYYTDANDNAVIIAGAKDEEGDEFLHQIRYIQTITVVVSLLLTVILGWIFIRNALSPISSIISQVSTLSPVKHSQRLPALTEKDEIADLIQTFNKLFDKLENAFGAQRNFVTTASHELFNPLTKIKSQLQVSLLQPRDNGYYRQTIESVNEDLDELTAMLQDLLNFSRLESYYSIERAPFRIDEMIFEVCDKIRSQSPASHIKLHFCVPSENNDLFIVTGNKALLSIAIKNIIENACKFSPDKSASIRLDIEGKTVAISIIDNGPGIPQEDIPHIFEPYYRSPSTETTKGFGIGLALAHRICKAHQIPLQVQSTPQSGTTFTIRFSN